MNPFVNPEFWLSLSFFIVLGMVVFSPIRHLLKKFWEAQQFKVVDKIDQAKKTLSEAQNLYKNAQKKSQTEEDKKNLNQQIKCIQQEFIQKSNQKIRAKKQDYQMRLNLTEGQVKNHLRSELLNKAEKLILKKSSAKALNGDIDHLILMLHENEEKLKKVLSES